MPLYDRDYMREPPRSALRGLTAFQIFLGINVLVFVAQFVFEIGWLRNPLNGRPIIPMGGTSLAELTHGHLWTLLTYMFVHNGPGHFMLNMILLWFAGRGVQQLFGSRHFAAIYLLSGVAGAAAELSVNGLVRGDSLTTLIGASASAFGLLMALAVALPEMEITAFIYFIIPVRLRLWTLAKTLFLIQFVFGMAGVLFNFLPEGMQIAYFAHLGGAVLGWFYARRLGYGGRPLTYAAQWQPSPVAQARRAQMARSHVRRQRGTDVSLEESSASAAEDTLVSLIEDEVNPILEKISQHGIGSLTEDERHILERASRELDRLKQDARGR